MGADRWQTPKQAAANKAPSDVASAFTQELLDEIVRDRFRPHVWQRLLSRSWTRSLEDLRASPALARSFWLWAAAVFATGAAVVLLAWLRLALAPLAVFPCLATPAHRVAGPAFAFFLVALAAGAAAASAVARMVLGGSARAAGSECCVYRLPRGRLEAVA